MTHEEVVNAMQMAGCSPEQIRETMRLIGVRSRVGALSTVINSERFDRFWRAWPNKVGKPAAQRAFKPVAHEIEAILAGIGRYVRDKPADRPWLNPSTFLNQRRWEDEPAPVSQPIYDARKDGLALLLNEVRNHEQRQSELSGADVRRLSDLSAFSGDADGNDTDIFGRVGNLHR